MAAALLSGAEAAPAQSHRDIVKWLVTGPSYRAWVLDNREFMTLDEEANTLCETAYKDTSNHTKIVEHTVKTERNEWLTNAVVKEENVYVYDLVKLTSTNKETGSRRHLIRWLITVGEDFDQTDCHKRKTVTGEDLVETESKKRKTVTA